MKRHLTLALTLMVLALLIQPCLAQVLNLKFKHLTAKEGLSQNTVTCILQDSKGFMWFGTQNGLNKYDGYRFTTYKHEGDNPNSISNNRILSILEDKAGNLWVATEWGLNRFNSATGTFSRYLHDAENPASISNNGLLSLFEDSMGNLWIGTSVGLNMLETSTGSFIHFVNSPENEQSLINNTVTVIYEDSKKNLWVGTQQGGLELFDRKSKTFKHHQHDPKNPNTLSAKHVRCILEDSKGNLWVGTSGGLNLFNREEGTFTRYHYESNDPLSLSKYQIMSLSEDANGLLWVGAEIAGLYVVDHQQDKVRQYIRSENITDGLSGSSIYSMFRDRHDNMWLGTYDGGINFYDWHAKKFKHYQRNFLDKSSLSNDWVAAFAEDQAGKIWVSTGIGVAEYKPKLGSFTLLFEHEGNRRRFSGPALMVDKEDNLWIGTWGSGITVVNPARTSWKSFQYNLEDPDGLPSDFIKAFAQDKEGIIWIATSGKGLAAYNPATNRFKSYYHNPENVKSISSDYLGSLLIDSKGDLWIGSEGGGLNLYDRKNDSFVRLVQEEKNPNSLSNNHVACLLEDQLGFIWVGTAYGLSRLDRSNNTFTSYYEKDGLPSNTIRSIQADRDGKLWITSIDALTQFDPAAMQFKTYTAEDGLQKGEFNNGSLKSRNGEIYLSSANGFNVFQPSEIKDNALIPQVYITGFQLFNEEVKVGAEGSILQKEISETREITLSYKHSVLSFDFAALGYSSPEKNKFAYKLEGFDKEWNKVEHKRNATYTNLDPGQYTFRVKASNNDGVWNEEGTAIKLTITPPFWQTWWFRALVIFSIVGGAISFYRVRINAVKAQKEKLERLVKEKTADLQEANNDLTERQEEILQQQEEIALQRDHLKIVNDQVMSSIQYAQTIQRAILPSPGKIAAVFPEHFILYRPKDVVSGDFYWFSHLSKEDSGLQADLSFMAAVDCTGHGVPGAFMSIIGSTILNEIVNQKHITDPARILELLHEGVKGAVEKAEGINTAGMDVCLCQFERGEGNQVRILFSGAKRDLLYVKKGSSTVEKLLADRRSIGSSSSVAFTTQELVLEQGSMLYLTTDGYADQNNPARQKLGTNTLNKHISELSALSVNEQKQVLEKALDDHQQDSEQRDDITLIGIQL